MKQIELKALSLVLAEHLNNVGDQIEQVKALIPLDSVNAEYVTGIESKILNKIDDVKAELKKQNNTLLDMLADTAEAFFTEKREAGATGVGLDADYWRAGIYRQGTAVQHFLGQFFVAQKDTSSEPATDDDWLRIGTAGFRHTGGFSETKAYAQGDLFTKDFSTFLVMEDGTTRLFSARGAKGATGEKGETGTSITDIHLDDSALVIELSNKQHKIVPMPDILSKDKIKNALESASNFESFKIKLMAVLDE